MWFYLWLINLFLVNLIFNQITIFSVIKIFKIFFLLFLLFLQFNHFLNHSLNSADKNRFHLKNIFSLQLGNKKIIWRWRSITPVKQYLWNFHQCFTVYAIKKLNVFPLFKECSNLFLSRTKNHIYIFSVNPWTVFLLARFRSDCENDKKFVLNSYFFRTKRECEERKMFETCHRVKQLKIVKKKKEKMS
jgi:hypothetical protein